MRRLLFLLLATLGLMLSLAVFQYLLAEAGVLALLGVRQYGVLVAGLILAWLGAIVTWWLGKDIGIWSMNVHPWPPAAQAEEAAALNALVARLAPNFGIRQLPELSIFPAAEVNAFAVGPSKNRLLLAVSQGFMTHYAPEQAEVMIAYALAKAASGDIATQLLLSGFVGIFTLFPVRILALFLGTALRTAEDETPTDNVEAWVTTVLELVLVPCTSLLVRAFGRLTQRRADQRVAQVLGSAAVARVLGDLARQYAAETHREVFTMPLKFGARVPARWGWLSYHTGYAERVAHLK